MLGLHHQGILLGRTKIVTDFTATTAENCSKALREVLFLLEVTSIALCDECKICQIPSLAIQESQKCHQITKENMINGTILMKKLK